MLGSDFHIKITNNRDETRIDILTSPYCVPDSREDGYLQSLNIEGAYFIAPF